MPFFKGLYSEGTLFTHNQSIQNEKTIRSMFSIYAVEYVCFCAS